MSSQETKKRSLFYKRDGSPIDDTLEWAAQFETNRDIAKTKFWWGGLLSTVFLGLDHNFDREGPPLIFETMLFYRVPGQDWLCVRYATEKEAKENHDKLAREYRSGIRFVILLMKIFLQTRFGWDGSLYAYLKGPKDD